MRMDFLTMRGRASMRRTSLPNNTSAPQQQQQHTPPPDMTSNMTTLLTGGGSRDINRREDEQVRADVRQLLQRLNNIIPFACLFLLKYIYAHAIGIVFFIGYSILLLKLNHQFRAQVAMKQDADRGMLIIVAITSLASIIIAYVIHYQVERQGPLLMLIPAPGDNANLEDLLWHILAADVCVRLLFTAFKAFVALMPCPHSWIVKVKSPSCHTNNSSSIDQLSHEGISLLRILSPPSVNTTTVSTSTSSSGVSEGSSTETETARMLMGHERRVQTSVHTRKRRIYCFIECVSLIIRSLLPAPFWLQYYSNDKTYGDLFVFMYMCMKCMVLSRYCKSLLATFRSMVNNSLLEFGKQATREELQEAGASDCSVCLESLTDDHSVVLPCLHFFCEECVSEWLERERTCPVCRAEVPPNSEGTSCRSRNGSTSAWPCIL